MGAVQRRLYCRMPWRLPKLNSHLALWGAGALVSLSLAMNTLTLFLYAHGYIKATPQLNRLLISMRSDIEHPGVYDMFQQIARFQQNPYNYVDGKPKQTFLMPLQKRELMGKLLESLGGFKTGVELGVQQGKFSEAMLTDWPSCEAYYLVDLWAYQPNYIDGANVDDATHELFMQETKDRLAPWSDKTHFIRDHTIDAVPLVPDNLDFVYIDARHDYCGARQDMEAWWPKIRPGGIMAGHDYRDAAAVWPRRDWALCQNGDRHPGSVAAAVNEFAMKNGVQVVATWGDWSSWMIRKPLHA